MKSKSDFPSLNQKLPEGLRPNGKPYKVMVVEDKEFQRKQIAQILESEGYLIAAQASNGRDAVQKFDALEGGIDIITTNLDMPVLDGYALVFEIKEKKKKPLIIFISEDTTKGVMQDLISMGIGDFILKPIDRRTILERIRNAVVKSGI